MRQKEHTPEQVANLLRKIEVAVANGKTTGMAYKEAQTTVQPSLCLCMPDKAATAVFGFNLHKPDGNVSAGSLSVFSAIRSKGSTAEVVSKWTTASNWSERDA